MKDKILNILTPFLGKNMSESSLSLYCKKLGISADAIGKNNLEDISKGLYPGLKIFLGDAKANQILDSIKKL